MKYIVRSALGAACLAMAGAALAVPVNVTFTFTGTTSNVFNAPGTVVGTITGLDSDGANQQATSVSAYYSTVTGSNSQAPLTPLAFNISASMNAFTLVNSVVTDFRYDGFSTDLLWHLVLEKDVRITLLAALSIGGQGTDPNSYGLNGITFTVTPVTVDPPVDNGVPEPGSLALSALALLGAGALRRRAR